MLNMTATHRGEPNNYGGVALRRIFLFLVLAMTLVAATSVGGGAQAQQATPPTPECNWYDNPERGWGWDYWCYNPSQLYWEPAFFGVTFDDVDESKGTPSLPTPTCAWYDNPAGGSDYWCSHPTQQYRKRVLVGVTVE